MLAQGERSRSEAGGTDIRTLLISDAPAADALRVNLERSAVQLRFSRPGGPAIAAAIEDRPQLVLVDCRADEARALQLCATLRSLDELAASFLVVITRNDRDELRLGAFEAGADDCFSEPASGSELAARLEPVRRRIRRERSSDVLRYEDVELDVRRHKVRRDGTPIMLSSLQLRLLKYLMENPAVVFTRQELLEAVWGDSTLDEGAVTVGIVRLRRALNSTGRPNLIRQVRGIGYALDSDADL